MQPTRSQIQRAADSDVPVGVIVSEDARILPTTTEYTITESDDGRRFLLRYEPNRQARVQGAQPRAIRAFLAREAARKFVRETWGLEVVS